MSNGEQPQEYVKIVDKKGEAYKGFEQKVPELSLDLSAQEVLGSERYQKLQGEFDKVGAKFKEKYGGRVWDSKENYDKMHAVLKKFSDRYNKAINNLKQKLDEHGVRPKKGDTPEGIRKRVLATVLRVNERAAKEARERRFGGEKESDAIAAAESVRIDYDAAQL